jgi:HPt (histidine-containing phosphotransfer) domain-containing protein
MAYDPGAIEATLAAAVGDDPQLIAELRHAFLDGARRMLATIESAETAEDWSAALDRLKGLAASFGAVRLMSLADAAVGAAPGDPQTVLRLRRALARF